jgi:hypothetical protein
MLQNQLLGFFERFDTDLRLTPFHISLYLALLHQWQRSSFAGQLILNKKAMQQHSRIGSPHTLYRCLKELSMWGYIAYSASKNPVLGSSITIHRLTPKASGSGEPAVTNTAERKSRIPPEQAAVADYFREMGYPSLEAQKFFNHFQSNGWRVGGKAPMRDWQAAARNWIINSQSFTKTQTQQPLNLSTPKSYDEPL